MIPCGLGFRTDVVEIITFLIARNDFFKERTYIHLTIHLFIHLTIHLFVHLFKHLFIHLSILVAPPWCRRGGRTTRNCDCYVFPMRRVRARQGEETDEKRKRCWGWRKDLGGSPPPLPSLPPRPCVTTGVRCDRSSGARGRRRASLVPQPRGEGSSGRTVAPSVSRRRVEPDQSVSVDGPLIPSGE